MRFYLDENFPLLAAKELAILGHTVFRAVDLHPQGTPDKFLLEDAQTRLAIFLTTDKDFYHTVPLLVPRRVAAIVCFTLAQPTTLEIWSHLNALLNSVNLDDEGNAIFLVKNNRVLRRP